MRAAIVDLEIMRSRNIDHENSPYIPEGILKNFNAHENPIVILEFDQNTIFYDQVSDIKTQEELNDFIIAFHNFLDDFGIDLQDKNYQVTKLFGSVINGKGEKIPLTYIVFHPMIVPRPVIMKTIEKMLCIPNAWQVISNMEIISSIEGDNSYTETEEYDDLSLGEEKPLEAQQKENNTFEKKENFYKIRSITEALPFNIDGKILCLRDNEKELFLVTPACMEEFLSFAPKEKVIWERNEDMFRVLIPSLKELHQKMVLK